MPYHLLDPTQAAKDRLFAHHARWTGMAPVLPKQRQAPMSVTPDPLPLLSPPNAQAVPNAFITATTPSLPQAPNTLLKPVQNPQLSTSSGPPRPPSSLLQPLTQQPVTLGTGRYSSGFVNVITDHPYLFKFSIILLFLVVVVVVILFLLLTTHKKKLDIYEIRTRRLSKGTSKFRHKPAQLDQALSPADLEEGREVDVDVNSKARRKNRGGWFRSPGFAVKRAVAAAKEWIQWAVRTSTQGRRSPLPTVRGFEGQLHAPVAARPWGGIQLYDGYALPPHTTALSPPPTTSSARPAARSTTSRIHYGVPPAIKSTRARRPTITSLVPETDDRPEPVSILREQFFGESEASSASTATASIDEILLQGPRGDQKREEKDLEGLEGKSVSLASRGPRKAAGMSGRRS